MSIKQWAWTGAAFSLLILCGCEQPQTASHSATQAVKPAQELAQPEPAADSGPKTEPGPLPPGSSPSSSSPEVTPDFSPGLAVGERVPDFILADANGTERALANLFDDDSDQFLALVFFRSADW